MNTYVNACASNVQTFILAPIVNYLTGKGVTVTVEELSQVLQLPAVKPSTFSGPAVPPMSFTGAVPPMAHSATHAPGTKKGQNTVTEAPVSGKSCAYQYKRGENKGKFCGKPTEPGSDFCHSCRKQRKSLSKDLAVGAVPGAAPNLGSIPAPSFAPPPAATGQLNVVMFDEAKSLYRTVENNFIVSQVSPGNIVVLGKYVSDKDTIVPITPEDEAVAVSMGLKLPTKTSDAPPVNVPSVPSIPSVPALPSVPSVPALPSVPSVPSIPSLPVPSPSAAQVPSLPPIGKLNGNSPKTTPSLPALPGIPQLQF